VGGPGAQLSKRTTLPAGHIILSYNVLGGSYWKLARVQILICDLSLLSIRVTNQLCTNIDIEVNNSENQPAIEHAWKYDNDGHGFGSK
jgi:hypothetical protein